MSKLWSKNRLVVGEHMIIKSKDNDTMIFTESGVSLRIQSLLDAYGEKKYRIIADTGFGGLNMGFFDSKEEAKAAFNNIEKGYCATQQTQDALYDIINGAWQKMLNDGGKE